jgi:hypothetical protein
MRMLLQAQSASFTVKYTDLWLDLNIDESISLIPRKPVEGLRDSFCALCSPVVKSNIFISEPALASKD